MQHKAAAASTLLLALIAAAARGQCLFSFDAPRGVQAGSRAVGVADFDADRRLDVVAAARIAYGFAEVAALPLEADEAAVHVADVDGDGRPDILAASKTQLIALLNGGQRTFTRKATPAALESWNSRLVFGDFNADGRLDVFAGGVYLSNRDGTFTLEADGPAFNSSARWVAADVNGDGRDHLVGVPWLAGPALVYIRQANGFAPVQPGPFVNGVPMAAADFDGDGRDDLLVVPEDTRLTPVLYFNVAGTAARQNISVDQASYIAADLNGDGAPDLLGGTGPFEGVAFELRAYLNDGHGNLRRVAGVVPGMERMPFAADADGDGVVDLILGQEPEDDLFVLHGYGDGTFRVPSITFPPATSALSGDFDADGDDDVVLLTGTSAPNGAIAWNNGDNTFRFVSAVFPGIKRLFQASDVDGDGTPEIVAQTDQKTAAVLALRPDGTVSELARVGTDVLEAAAGDFSGQHRKELVVISGDEILGSSNKVEVFELRTGAAPRFSATRLGEAFAVVAADFNGDGADDIAVAGGTASFPFCCHDSPTRGSDGFISTFLSTRTSFEPKSTVSYPSAALVRAVAGDFDGDGRIDIATATSFHGQPLLKVIAWYGDGAGSFAHKQELETSPNFIYALHADDFNGDGATDLAANGLDHVYLGGRGGLTEHGSYFGPLIGRPLSVRAKRGALPWLLAPRPSPLAFVYRPICARGRAARVPH